MWLAKGEFKALIVQANVKHRSDRLDVESMKTTRGKTMCVGVDFTNVDVFVNSSVIFIMIFRNAPETRMGAPLIVEARTSQWGRQG